MRNSAENTLQTELDIGIDYNCSSKPIVTFNRFYPAAGLLILSTDSFWPLGVLHYELFLIFFFISRRSAKTLFAQCTRRMKLITTASRCTEYRCTERAEYWAYHERIKYHICPTATAATTRTILFTPIYFVHCPMPLCKSKTHVFSKSFL